MPEAAYDYIIVGAGSAGSVLANRLSARPEIKVLLLEAGGSDKSLYVRMPAGIASLAGPRFNWGYETAPQAAMQGRRMYWPRGRLIGGSSSVNAMVYMRGQPADYDHWRQLGNAGWSYADVLPWFKKAERNERLHDEFHGSDGPLNVAERPYTNPLSQAFVEAGQQAGLPFNPDFNGSAQLGCRAVSGDAEERPALERGVGLSASGGGTREPHHRHQGAGHPRADRERPRRRRRICPRPQAAHGACDARSGAGRRRHQLAAASVAFRHRPGRRAAHARRTRRARPAWRRQELAGPSQCQHRAPGETRLGARRQRPRPGAARRGAGISDLRHRPRHQQRRRGRSVCHERSRRGDARHPVSFHSGAGGRSRPPADGWRRRYAAFVLPAAAKPRRNSPGFERPASAADHGSELSRRRTTI